MKFKKYKSIEQFRNTISNYIRNYNYIGQNNNDEPMYDVNMKKEILRFHGTVKCHGSNAGVMFTKDGEIKPSKRSAFMDINQNGLNGFSIFVNMNQDLFNDLLNELKIILNVKRFENITVFGEWAGKGIQKGVAVSELEKFFYIFSVKITSDENDSFYYHCNEWFNKITNIKTLNQNRIFFTEQFKTFDVDIDFENPMISSNKIANYVDEVEKLCPIGDYFGVDGIGEGIVWIHKNYIFKTKGQKHSISKTKKLVPIDPEVLENIKKFVMYAVTKNRMEQAIIEVYGSIEDCDQKDNRIAKYLNWIKEDIIKEEIDVIKENNIDFNKTIREISKVANKYLFKIIEGV